MKQSKELVAWTVTCESTPAACVVFHHHGLAARRLGSERLGEDFDYLDCRRSPEFDYFAKEGSVPTKALLEAGWWFECHHCQKKLPDEDFHPWEDLAIDGDFVFCDHNCKSQHEKEVNNRNAGFEEFKQKVQSLRPDLEFTKFQGGYPWISMVANFTFPGAKYGGSVRDQHGDGTISWHIANGDLEIWKEYEANFDNQEITNG
ncbi:hypothetical protein [Vibrio sp. TBV020]|uniref:hypothetical protein n=1 Tax=Vibrio sp. TBV020 TaxID=3137398 RepID=UPI0038CD4F66